MKNDKTAEFNFDSFKECLDWSKSDREYKKLEKNLRDSKDYFNDENSAKSTENIAKNAKKQQNLSKNAKSNNYLGASIFEWIEIILKVSPFVASIYEFVDNLFNKMAFGSYAKRRSYYGVEGMFEEIISVVERKKELCNLSYVASSIYGVIDENDLVIVEATITHKRKISDLARKGHYKPIYQKRDRILKNLSSFCLSQGWNSEFMEEHFSGEPLVRYSYEHYFKSDKSKEQELE